MKYLSLILLIVLTLWPTPAKAQTAAGVIAGTVMMEEGELPNGLSADLLFLPNGQGPPQITNQPLADGGAFRFEGLDTSPEHRYLVRVTNEGVEQYSEIQAFTEGTNELAVTLRLTAVSRDASTLSVPEISYLMDARPDGWIIAGLLSFNNSGEADVVNEDEPPVRVVLPDGAFNLDVPEADPTQPFLVSTTEDGFTFAGPFRTGDSQMIYSFQLPYGQGDQSVTLPSGLSADLVRVLVPELGQSSGSADFTATEQVESLSERNFAVWQTTDVPPDRVLSMDFSGLPPAPVAPPPLDENSAGTTPSQGTTPASLPRTAPISPLEQLPWWAALVPVALALLGAGLYAARRPDAPTAQDAATLRKRRDLLVAEIAALDIRHEAGAIGEQTHKRQRDALKRELTGVLMRLGGPPRDGVTE